MHVRIIIAAMRGHLAECERDARAIDQPVRRVDEHVARAARLGPVVHVHAQRRLAAQRLELDHQVGPVPGVRVRARVRVRVRVRASIPLERRAMQRGERTARGVGGVGGGGVAVPQGLGEGLG